MHHRHGLSQKARNLLAIPGPYMLHYDCDIKVD